MKRIFVFACFIFLAITGYSQNTFFTYQAVVRDNNNHLIINQTVSVRISLIRDTPNGTADYVETHSAQTNANGLLTLMVGKGSVVSGNMTNVDWGNHIYYLKNEVDLNGGNNYVVNSVQIVPAVPFAQFAASSDYTETQVLSISNDTIFLKGGTNSFVKLPITDIHIPDSISSYINDVGYITSDSIPTNISFFNNDAGYITSYTDSQQLSISGDTLKLERGGSVVLASSCCTLVDSLNWKLDSLNNGMDSLANVIATLESIVCMPQVITGNITSTHNDTAVCGGSVTSYCGVEVSDRGVCWNTTGTADISGNHTSDGNGTGDFVSIISGLAPNTTYYIRAYLISGNDIVYGNEIQFSIKIDAAAAAVTTAAVSSITNNSAVSGGNATADGGSSITKRGVCWSTSHNPTVADDRTADSLGLGSFTSKLTGLAPQTTYYVRAYAVNSNGIAYGEEKSFTTNGPCNGESSVTDIDNNEYEIVAIGSQCWMKENLRTITQPDGGGMTEGYYEEDCGWEESPGYYYRIDEYGEEIAYGEDWEDWWNDEGYEMFWQDPVWHDEWCPTYMYFGVDMWGSYYCNDAFYCYPDNNDQGSADTYGVLYNWVAAMNSGSKEGAQGICPNGWHIPTQAEYNTLISYVSSTSSCSGTATYTAKALASQDDWDSSSNACAVGNNLGDNNASGFSAEPAGCAGCTIGNAVSYWLSTESKYYQPYYFSLYYDRATIQYGTTSRDQYHSVRCIKD